MIFKDIINSLIKVLNENAYLNITINNTLKSRDSVYTEHDKKLYVRVTSGVVENKILLDYMLRHLISGQRVKPFAKNALRVGAYMISFLNTPNHYVVNEIVKAVKKEDYRASTFINAILRKYIDNDIYNTSMEKINKLSEDERLSILYSIDLDLVKLLKKQYKDVESILKPTNVHTNTYRVNTLKISFDEINAILKKDNIEYSLDGVTLISKESLINHSLFNEGKIVAQDASSIKVAEVANPRKFDKVLDVCSAPGSKSMHLAALMKNTGEITSCDIYEHKLKLIEDNAKKLGVTNVKTMLSDGTTSKYDTCFDLVVADVPCSGLGVISHKSDLKYNMTIAKIKEINDLQKKIINNVCNYVKVGGALVYSTCTINKDENENLIKEFLFKHKEFRKVEEHVLVQNFNNNQDGFYICKLVRI